MKDLPDEQRQDFIWDRIIYANPIKATETLEQLDQYKPLVTYDNYEEVIKIARYAPHAGLVLRLSVPNTGSMVELSSKFGALPGEAVDLMVFAQQRQARSRGPELPRRQPVHERPELHPGAAPVRGRVRRGQDARLRAQAARHRRRLPGALRRHRSRRSGPCAQTINPELDRLFPQPIEILAEPGRFLVASAATAVAQIIGKAVRGGKLCYYVNDGVYQTYSGVIFDHCQYPLKSFKNGPTQICSVFGPTCDALDTITLAEELPDMELGDYVYAPNIGAYSAASSTYFNGFPPAKVVHVNQEAAAPRETGAASRQEVRAAEGN